MIKALIVLAVLLGLLCYALCVASAQADRDAYIMYEEWKKRKEKERME